MGERIANRHFADSGWAEDDNEAHDVLLRANTRGLSTDFRVVREWERCGTGARTLQIPVKLMNLYLTLAVGLGLEFEHLGVEATTGDEFVVAADLNDAALIEDD